MTTTDAARAPRPWWLLDVVAAVALPVLAAALVVQNFSVYFSLGYPQPVPTGDEIRNYWITAAFALALGTGGLLAALGRRNRRAVLGYLAVGTLVLPSVLLFSVPHIDISSWMHQSPPPVSPNYCGRTDSENCPGG